MANIQSKIKGALFGFAIGDAMGATTEFMTAHEVEKLYGQVNDIIGGGWLHLKPGQITDDTQMMLCVCEAIERFPQNTSLMLNRCCENFSNWYLSRPIDIGGCCRAVISQCKGTNNHKVWLRIADDPSSLGNGSLMRTLPIILSGLDEDAALSQGRLTHNNRVCDFAISAYKANIESLLFAGGRFLHKSETLNEPTGHVLNTLENSLYWVQNTDSLEDAIIGAVNHGGDADTIAAITGSFAGALYGYEAIPKRWIDKLDPVIRIDLEKYAKLFENFNQKVCTK